MNVFRTHLNRDIIYYIYVHTHHIYPMTQRIFITLPLLHTSHLCTVANNRFPFIYKDHRISLSLRLLTAYVIMNSTLGYDEASPCSLPYTVVLEFRFFLSWRAQTGTRAKSNDSQRLGATYFVNAFGSFQCCVRSVICTCWSSCGELGINLDDNYTGANQ